VLNAEAGFRRHLEAVPLVNDPTDRA